MLRLSGAARADLQQVYLQGLELFGSRQADDYIEGLFAKLELLADFPRLGAARPELSADAHVIFYKSHAILYRIDDADVFVRRIRHVLEDWQSDTTGVGSSDERSEPCPTPSMSASAAGRSSRGAGSSIRKAWFRSASWNMRRRN
ncbi:type II toxin-antitoxin system RelE/ParE family toxin [uncultured Brevundimonas sp.]|uniref:type II toxin-antitoxin system RelE/ParE family toxin n=2 Tax=uncultured Brevundimonas sp. TaxID=213418 RepID=UPI00341EBAA8